MNNNIDIENKIVDINNSYEYRKQNMIKIKKDKIMIFTDYIQKIFEILGINNENDREKIKRLISKIDDDDKVTFVNRLEKKIDIILNQDAKFAELKLNLKDMIDFNEISVNWDKLMFQMGKLQTLILINKLKDGNINKLIDSIISAFDRKFNIINDILEENIGIGQQNGGYKRISKYLKYKIKYLEIKI